MINHKLIFLTALIPLLVIAPSISVYASSFTAFNVNLNKTVTLPAAPTSKLTGIQDFPCAKANPVAHLKHFTASVEDRNKELSKDNGKMYQSDVSEMFAAAVIPGGDFGGYYWCGITK